MVADTVLVDHSVHRVFVLGGYQAFAGCLPGNVKTYKWRQYAKGWTTLQAIFRGFAGNLGTPNFGDEFWGRFTYLTEFILARRQI